MRLAAFPRASVAFWAFGTGWAVLAFATAAAFAHGNAPSPATFTNPPRLQALVTDGGDRMWAPYTFATADTSFDVAWTDGDTDPISEHFFYYMDHAPPLALAVTDVQGLATPIPESAGGFWVACSCPDDFGVVCPDIGTRDCRNGFTWDTHALPPGSYWLIAITRDPPYDVYTVSDGPVRIAHGGPLPPAAIIVRPDGFGTFDTSYTARWILIGTDPTHVDLAYNSDDDVRAGSPWKPLASDVPLMAGPDGTFSFEWDLSALASARIFHLQATVKDATGQTVFTQSRNGVTVFHPGDNPDYAVSVDDVDMGTAKKTGGSGCAYANATGGAPTPLFVLALCALVIAAGLVRGGKGRRG
jgi:hypothetical protein